jgi:hypothetical protein
VNWILHHLICVWTQIDKKTQYNIYINEGRKKGLRYEFCLNSTFVRNPIVNPIVKAIYITFQSSRIVKSFHPTNVIWHHQLCALVINYILMESSYVLFQKLVTRVHNSLNKTNNLTPSSPHYTQFSPYPTSWTIFHLLLNILVPLSPPLTKKKKKHYSLV